MMTLYFSNFAAISNADRSLRYASELGRCFEVPAMNVHYFVGRDLLIERIHGYLQKVNTMDDCLKIVVLHGIGGEPLLSQSADQS